MLRSRTRPRLSRSRGLVHQPQATMRVGATPKIRKRSLPAVDIHKLSYLT